MWICKTCGQNNDDAQDSCLVCGSTEKEHYTPPPAPEVKIPTAEERKVTRPTGTIDPTTRRPIRIPTYVRRDTTLRPPTPSPTPTPTPPPRPAPTPSRPTSTPTRPTPAPTRRGLPWWIIPTVLAVISFATFYPLMMFWANKYSFVGINLSAAMPLFSVFLFIHCAAYHGGKARAIGPIGQYIGSVFIFAFLTFTSVAESLCCGVVAVSLVVFKILGIIRCFKQRRLGFAISQIIFTLIDAYVALASFAILIEALA